MNAQQLKQYLPIAKHALLLNALLIAYYLLPNLTSFLTIALILTITLAPDILQQINCCQEKKCCSANDLFRNYLQLSGVHKLMVIVGLGLAAQLTYLLPSWFILLVVVQVFAFWEILVSFGLVELSAGAINGTERALTKFLSLIPKYQE